MTRKPSKRQARAARRTQEAALQLLMGGAAFVIGPWLASQTVIGQALLPWNWFGWLMLAIGGGMLWLRARSAAEVKADDASRQTAAPVVPARPTVWSKAVFDVIEWRRFEAVVEALFQQAGFETRSQPHGADGGIDIWLYSRHQPGQAASVVQCKHWKHQRVGVAPIRELRGVMAAHKVARGQFATTSGFTPEAAAFARANGIRLIDADGLLTLMARRTPEQRQALLGIALEGDYWRPTCASCGTKMVERTSRRGANALWGCVNFPRCRTRPLPRQV